MIQVSFNCWPLARQDAVNTGIAKYAICANAVVAQNAIGFRTYALNCAPALGVEKVRAKLYGDAMQCLKCVL